MAIATVRQDGDTLAFGGALERAAIAALWPQLRSAGNGVRRLDLGAVSSVDSAGLALLVELCARTGITEVTGSPAGLAELRAAYRLGADWNLALSVNNVFDRSYETVRYFNQPGRNYLLTLRYRPAE